jgi:hypothetical protein
MASVSNWIAGYYRLTAASLPVPNWQTGGIWRIQGQ